MRKKIVGIFVCTLVITTALPAIDAVSDVKKNGDEQSRKVGWIQHFEGNSWASSVIQTSDGGYLVAGGVGYYPDSNAYLLKTDANGTKLWENTYGNESGWDAFWGGLIETSDGGYVASGTNNSTSYLVKVDSDGNTLWERLYGEPTTGSILDVQETNDTGLILTGRVYYEPRRGWLIKTDGEGYVLWNKTLGGENPTTLWTIRIADDGGFIMAGFEHNPEDLIPISYAVKTDTSGNVEWENTYESCNTFHHGVVETSDGGYIFSGDKIIPSRLNLDQVSLVKTDAAGNEVWSKYFGVPFLSDALLHIEKTSDGGCIALGYTMGIGTVINFIRNGYYFPLWSKIWLLKIDANGSMEWNKKIETGVGRSVKQTTDGGYILAGLKGAYNSPEGILLIKTDENGNID